MSDQHDESNVSEPPPAAETSPTDPPAAPAPGPEPVPPPSSSAAWPTSAKATVAVLAVIAIAAIVLAIVGFAQASSNDDDTSTAETDRDLALDRADTAESERDALASQLADSQSTVDSVTSERDQALADNEQLQADLTAQTERADTAEEQLAAIADSFPVVIDSSLEGQDLAGTWNITYAEAYCDGFSTCGTLPTVPQANITTTPEGFLRLVVPGILDAGLFAIDGSLYGITDSLTALPPCGATQRRARITVTMYADDVTIQADGTRIIDSLGSSLTVDAPAAEGCPSGLVFYGASLTPAG